MEQLLDYRDQLISRLGEAAREFCDACGTVGDRKTSSGWTVHQTAVHVRDVNRLVYGMRARRTIEAENPLFERFDRDGWMVEHYDPDEPLEKVLVELQAGMSDLVHWLRALPSEAWARESRHAVLGGGFTLQTWVEQELAHLEEHLDEVKSKP